MKPRHGLILVSVLLVMFAWVGVYRASLSPGVLMASGAWLLLLTAFHARRRPELPHKES